MTEAQHLFDPNEFGPGRKPRRKTVHPDVPVEPLCEGWSFLRNRHGMMPYCHRVASTTQLGASVTECGAMGTVMSEPGVNVMRRCPKCDAAALKLA